MAFSSSILLPINRRVSSSTVRGASSSMSMSEVYSRSDSANSKSCQYAKKRQSQAGKRRLRNRVYRSRARTYVKQTTSLMDQGKLDEAAQAAQLAVSALDRTAQKGVVHRRNADRRKSRLMKRLPQAQAESAER